ncbi:flagellar type III secretion system pore protein FliP [Galbitalea soli]|uniref:Flagellar biosynthetic protein FliP n=1 Tax=Galbitalea soli TaxID=1268042 RepID=A0A7C9PN59_9MICO|nr:flagellar type III secretion system pore protein FliP [Galbitalea soli]NEM91188.1 flagellar type III secretion system pore protein FliP [Galbitalea soli]NYJ29877.1 flagellar biosynthetic protein FliP [Galbitalea soli]
MRASASRRLRVALAAAVSTLAVALLTAGAPSWDHLAKSPTPVPTPTAPSVGDLISVNINGPDGTPSSSVLVLIGITLLSVAPALILMMSSFTKIFVVLAMTRNAMGLTNVPPNQVLVGLALFLSLFIMWPVIQHVNTDALQPYLHGHLDFAHAIKVAEGPLRTFMVAHTRQEDLALITRAAGQANPASPSTVPMVTLIPAFMISELRSAFIIGFVIFVPFLIIDLVVSGALMAMGMMMLPPVMISLPFKILLFILVDGWGLLVTTLIGSYTGTS